MREDEFCGVEVELFVEGIVVYVLGEGGAGIEWIVRRISPDVRPREYCSASVMAGTDFSAFAPSTQLCSVKKPSSFVTTVTFV